MHRHYCEIEGHEWQCAEDCACICGLPMEENHHSECPIELRPCPEHVPEAESRMQVVSSEMEHIQAIANGLRHEDSLPHCKCGCADLPFGAAVGFCLYCDHVYSDWDLTIQAEHFGRYCPGTTSDAKRVY